MSKLYLRMFILIYLFMAALSIASASEFPDNEAQKVLHELQEAFQAPELSTLSRLDIDFTNRKSSAESSGLLKVLLDTRAPTNIVREISVSGYPSLGNWTLVAEVFEKLSGLQDVYWRGEKAIPKNILTSLEERNPYCRLHYNPSFNYWDPYDKDVPQIQVIAEEPQHRDRSHEREAILGSRSLYALKAEIEYGYYPNLEDLNLVFQALATCPNLKELDLSITTEGCEVSSAAPSAFDFMSNPDVRFPPLERLTLSGYRFDERSDGGTDWQYVEPEPWKDRLRWPWSVLPESFVDWVGEYSIQYSYRGVKPWNWPQRREPDGKTSLDCWLEVMDWSHLHNLNLRWPKDSTLAKLSGDAVPNLKNLTLVDGNSDAVISFLANTSHPLGSISLQEMGLPTLEPVADVIVEYQSKELTCLSIYQSESEWFSSGKPVISLNATELSTLLKSLTKLQHLNIDVNRTETWNYEIYDILASSPSLDSLMLHFPSPDLNSGIDAGSFASQTRDLKDADDEIDPIVNQTSVQNLFKYLREEKEEYSIGRLEVLVGNWEDRFQGGGMLERLRKRVARYTCEVDGDGMEVCEGRQMRNVAY